MTDLDAAFARIETLATTRDLRGIFRATSYGTPALKVATRTFCRLKDAATLVLLCPEEQKALLMDISPQIYFQTPHSVGWPSILIRLDVIGDEELALRLEDAWRHRAPAKLAASRPLPPPPMA